MIGIHKVNESYARMEYDEDKELSLIYNALSYYPANYRFMPAYRNGIWDGQIHLMDASTGAFPLGLVRHVLKTAKELGIEFKVDSEVARCFFNVKFNKADFDNFLEATRFFSGGNEIFPRDDQIEATQRALESKRCINLCPTSFGKSLSITMECLYLVQQGLTCLIVVPTKDLVDQFANDIKDYATNEDGQLEPWYPKIQMIYGGKDKDLKDDTQICISTWQSLHSIWKGDRKYMNQFDCICLDECFNEDALVTMSDGSHKKIKDVVVGDKILNYSEDKHIFKEDVVESIHKNLTVSMEEKMLELTFDNGAVIKCTANHRFLTKSGWKRADELNEDDEIVEHVTSSTI